MCKNNASLDVIVSSLAMGASRAPGNKAGNAEVADTAAKNRAITIYLTARRVRAKLAGRTKRRHLPFALLPLRRTEKIFGEKQKGGRGERI